MKLLLVLAAAFSAVSPTMLPRPHSAWKYQRSITPAPRAPEAEQCVVLDADTFSHAAPGLRDLRLLQDGREIPYALDESHDAAFDSAALSGTHSRARMPDNRAQYEVSILIAAHPSDWAAAVGPGAPDHPPGWFHGGEELPAHVPVERIRLLPEASAAETLGFAAWQGTNEKERENFEVTLTPQNPAVNFTVGSNLQTTAGVNVGVHGSMPVIWAFVLEMRRRELCFQPLSRAPLLLLLGNQNAHPVHYEYARAFLPNPAPLLASLGPLDVNPAYRIDTARSAHMPTLDQLLLAIFAACILTIAVSTHTHRRGTH